MDGLVLITPPGNELTMPHLGVALLKGFLCGRGYNKVTVIESGIRAFHYLTQKTQLERCMEKIEQEASRIGSKSNLRYTEQHQYYKQMQALASSRSVLENLSAAIKVLQGESFYDLKKYNWSTGIVNRACELVAAAHYPTHWSLTDYHSLASWQSTKDILSILNDENQNLMLPFYRELVKDIINQHQSVVIGLSITHASQFIPGITIASIFKKTAPNMFVILGGAFIHHVYRELYLQSALWKYFDCLAPGSGELPLEQLLESLDSGREPINIPGLIFDNDDFSEITAPDQITPNNLPTPDYSDIYFDDFLVPEPTVPIFTNHGCWWGKCGFCSRDNYFKERAANLIVNDMIHLNHAYGINSFFLSGDVHRLKTLLAISSAINRTGIDIFWSADVRSEKGLTTSTVKELRKGGCREIRFGLESGNSRVLQLMGKGISIDDIINNIHSCRAAGIHVRLSFMVGFPGEELLEAQETLDLVLSLSDQISFYDFSVFCLEKGSRCFEKPKEYGITRVYEDDGRELSIHRRYDVDNGCSAFEAMELSYIASERLRGQYWPQCETINKLKAHSLLHANRWYAPPIRPKNASKNQLLLNSNYPNRLLHLGDVSFQRTNFDISRLEQIVAQQDREINTLLLRYGVTVQECRILFESEVATLKPHPCWLIYIHKRDALVCISDILMQMLKHFTPPGSNPKSVLDKYPEEIRCIITETLSNLIVMGALEWTEETT